MPLYFCGNVIPTCGLNSLACFLIAHVSGAGYVIHAIHPFVRLRSLLLTRVPFDLDLLHVYGSYHSLSGIKGQGHRSLVRVRLYAVSLTSLVKNSAFHFWSTSAWIS